ncbi:MMPL family transporter [Candidatus Woesearchaeota archaeon]|nr:MMPL family transporter [Candidatus Woesearchaeota archaeon]
MSLVDRYADLAVRKPWALIIAALLITVFMVVQSQQVETVPQDNQDALPDDVPVIDAFSKIEAKFGGSDTAKIAYYLDAESPEGVEDIRHPDVVATMALVKEMLATVEDVEGVSGPTSALEASNGGTLPKTRRGAIELYEDTSMAGAYVSDDYTLAYQTVRLDADYDSTELLQDLEEVTTRVTPPPGVTVKPAGEVLAGPAVSRQISNDMSRTSTYSLLGIVIVLLLIFMSIRFAVIPLATIGLGVMWTLGWLGIIGINLSSTTSGVISMIMGIGIDFGIQIVSRFRQEMRENHIQTSMRRTLNAVIKPMTATTVSAIIGFKAMGLGKITFLAEMGEIMSYGVAGSYLAALILIPGLLVLYYTVFETNKMKRARQAR